MRRRPALDLSTNQLVAGGLATLAAAVGASFLGVYGTVLGAALMSVVSTAGTALGQHYLDRAREQIKERTHLHDAAHGETVARGAAGAATSADPTRTIVLPGGDPQATRFDPDPNATRFDADPNATRLDADPSATRLDLSPAETVADVLAAEAGHQAVERAAWRQAFRDTLAWAQRRWIMLAVSSVAVFAVVMTGITVLEKITDRPASGWVGANDGRGTTWSNLGNGEGGGGTPGETPSQAPTGETGQPTDAPTTGSPETTQDGEPTPGSTTEPEQPGRPTPQPSSEPTAPPTTQPPTTTPPGDDGGEQGGSDPDSGADTQRQGIGG
jgi:hypothetical protein